MKKEYFSPEMEEFKYEIPTLFAEVDQSGLEDTSHESGGGAAD